MISQKKRLAILLKARKRAAWMEKMLERHRGASNALELADAYLKWTADTSSGRYASSALENIYLDCAKRIQVPCEVPFSGDTCLVVMSRVYASGGHTRWVERWIESDSDRIYSLALTYTQEQELPERLKSLVLKRGGEIIDLSGGDIWVRSAKLRDVSMRFACILVATHLDDVSPLLAYGVEDFPRPICLMNHGNHLFWPGVSIADVILEAGVWQQGFSERYRGSKVSRRVKIPLSVVKPSRMPSKADARKRLGLPLDMKIVLTAGSSRKYRQGGFERVIEGLLAADSEVFFISMGDENVPVDGTNRLRRWSQVRDRYGERIRILPTLPHAEFQDYCCSADVLIDSFPFTGGGVMNDAMRCGCPCVTIARTIIDPFRPFVRCVTVEEIIFDTLILLRSPERRAAIIDAYRAYSSSLDDSKDLQDASAFMQDFVRRKHCLHPFTSVVSVDAPNDDVVFATRYDARSESYWRHVFMIQLLPFSSMRTLLMSVYQRARRLAHQVCGWRRMSA